MQVSRSDVHAGDTLSGRTLPAAVLWDMDGTLIDSEPYWMGAENALVAEHGGSWSYEQGLALVGTPLTRSAATLQAAGVQLEIPEIVDFLINRVAGAVRQTIPWQPGAIDVLTWLRDQGVPCALVTMSYTPVASAFIEQAPAGVFSAVVTGDEVTHGKPHPEAYLTAAERLGVSITDCLAVEDSPSGVGSALACGAVPVGIEVIVPVVSDPRLNRITSLSSMTPQFFHDVMTGTVIDHIGER
ncbi:HAD family hydrolase [Sanguibacter suarezii]|uniref:HAD family hydrolase n=1 Tax=Sanguibacter suarezii TaxID=60921 RepID=UPI00247FE433|nr:HAD family phosphatase [Sanguibacter suarezii]